MLKVTVPSCTGVGDSVLSVGCVSYPTRVFNVLAGTFAPTPPPTKYLIVSVVFEGARPYDFVDRKFEGSNA